MAIRVPNDGSRFDFVVMSIMPVILKMVKNRTLYHGSVKYKMWVLKGIRIEFKIAAVRLQPCGAVVGNVRTKSEFERTRTRDEANDENIKQSH